MKKKNTCFSLRLFTHASGCDQVGTEVYVLEPVDETNGRRVLLAVDVTQPAGLLKVWLSRRFFCLSETFSINFFNRQSS